jgi:hypothetical protein
LWTLRPVGARSMSDLYVFTIFESDGGRPRCTGVKAGDKIKIYDLFRPGARKIIGTINQHINIIRSLFIRANNKGHRIVTSDFKNHLAAFGLPLELRPYNVYDLHLPDVRPTDTARVLDWSLSEINQGARWVFGNSVGAAFPGGPR